MDSWSNELNIVKCTPFNIFLSTTLTLRPLALKAVAMKIPKVPPQTTTSHLSTAFSARAEWLNTPGKLETTCWGSCGTANRRERLVLPILKHNTKTLLQRHTSLSRANVWPNFVQPLQGIVGIRATSTTNLTTDWNALHYPLQDWKIMMQNQLAYKLYNTPYCSTHATHYIYTWIFYIQNTKLLDSLGSSL